MTKWIVRTAVVIAVAGAFAAGRGLRASAEVPGSQAQRSGKGTFVCGESHDRRELPGWLTRTCNRNGAFTVTYLPTTGGGTILACCLSE